ncbi:restriction endonuclease subunit S [Vibrio cholerae]|uniref:restriction endonuclease subunit S n=1 Tax=Vibrio cholerae TaxID=666 RepID=UPI001A9D4D62|nr:restriction endonuclease subunit S [Vibrio cholerae]MBO1368054.1 hypothetical protein [Vibrio cholerae]MBO1371773.1 hypothetical protein [Vibrio cholerae]MBO1375515.1 hypothetical protein [Vibrio cholerae]MBO1379235.1 hypothetical protein [Vibrio cholerae]MBO1409053.1 hypothetical protein [Vibrio cholerae]
MVPNGWNSKPLVQLLEKIIDYRGQSVPKSSSGIPLITARNVREGYLDFSNQEYVDESKFKEWMTRGIPQKGDILFTTEAPLGKACRYPSEGTYAVGQRTVTLRTNKKLDSEFLLYTILSERGQLLIDLRSTGSTAKGIKSSELKKVKITYPESLPEQQKIAKILSTWDKAIATTERLIATSQQQKKSLMQQLLTGKKRLVNPETGTVFEGDWESVKLGDLASKITKGTTPSTNGFQFQEHGINFVKVESVMKSGKFDVSKFAYINEECHSAFKRSQLEQGDILFSIAGALGRTALVTKDILPANTNQALSIVRLKKRLSNVEFVLHYLNSSAVAAIIKGLTAQAAQPNLSLKDVGNLPIKLPSALEQQKIASVLTAADKEIELLQTKLAHLKDEKKALMQQLLTGKRRVKVEENVAA